MIEKTNNILKDKKIKRILEYNDDSKQITIGDQRFYQRKEKSSKRLRRICEEFDIPIYNFFYK
jgi:hypothetical protein